MDYISRQRQRILATYGITPIQKSEENSLEKGGKHGMIGEIRNGYKKVAEGKWQKVSSEGRTKSEHREFETNFKNESAKNIKEGKQQLADKYQDKSSYHGRIADELDDKEYDDTHVFGASGEDSLEKGGEGSRGGKVIGHTRSGKAIYQNNSDKNSKHFTKEDHKDASAIHHKHLSSGVGIEQDKKTKKQRMFHEKEAGIENQTESVSDDIISHSKNFEYSGEKYQSTLKHEPNLFNFNRLYDLRSKNREDSDHHYNLKREIERLVQEVGMSKEQAESIPWMEDDIFSGDETKEKVVSYMKNMLNDLREENQVVKSQTQDFFGANIHQQQSLQKAHLLQSFQSENTPYDLLEKGGKRATIGEVRTWGNEKWVKHQDGWVHVHPKTEKATIEKPGGKREEASEKHKNHYKHHIGLHSKSENPFPKGTFQHDHYNDENKLPLKKIKVSYTEETKKSYETSETPIGFTAIINGVTCKGYWRPSRGQYVSSGVDINELQVGGKRIKIFDDGGTHKTYEIAANLQVAEKQPKDLRFTGQTLSVSNLKKVFIDKIQDAVNNPDKEPKLSKQFLTAFNLLDKKLPLYGADEVDSVGKVNTLKQKLNDAGYSDSDIEDLTKEWRDGGSKVPKKFRDIIEGKEEEKTPDWANLGIGERLDLLQELDSSLSSDMLEELVDRDLENLPHYLKTELLNLNKHHSLSKNDNHLFELVSSIQEWSGDDITKDEVKSVVEACKKVGFDKNYFKIRKEDNWSQEKESNRIHIKSDQLSRSIKEETPNLSDQKRRDIMYGMIRSNMNGVDPILS